jgi:hypothetical protein
MCTTDLSFYYPPTTFFMGVVDVTAAHENAALMAEKEAAAAEA